MTYPISYRKVLIISVIMFGGLSLAFSFTPGQFDIESMKMGMIIGGGFTLLLQMLVFGQKVEITGGEVIYYPNWIAWIVSTYKKKLILPGIREVRLGLPRKNKEKRTFAAINISSQNEEISFNPDLFDFLTLVALFKELRKNQSIKFDEFSLKLMDRGDDRDSFRRQVFGNFFGRGD